MKNRIDIEKIIKKFKTSEFLLGCQMPTGYNAGIPILQIKNGRLCLTIPYLRYKVTGEVDKTLVYPIRYTVTLELPEQRIVGFVDLTCEKKMESIPFDKPIGFFRHDSIKHLNKAQYRAHRQELMALYSKLANALLGEGEFTPDEDARLGELLKMLTEPCLYPMYKMLDRDFYQKYLG